MCELNKIKNVKIIQTAISDKKEDLFTNDELTQCSFVYNSSGNEGKYKIEAVSLDYLYNNSVIENIGYIHLDVEGMEYKVLKGSENIIDTFRPIITFEQHLELDDYNIILTYLKNKKYNVFLVDEILPGCRSDCRNSFAFPNEIYNNDILNEINIFIGKNVLIEKYL
jgi:hypothetical protein